MIYAPFRIQDVTVGDTQWLRSFIAVKNLHLSETCEYCIVSALQDFVWRRVTGVLPALQNPFLEESQPSRKPFDNLLQRDSSPVIS